MYGIEKISNNYNDSIPSESIGFQTESNTIIAPSSRVPKNTKYYKPTVPDHTTQGANGSIVEASCI